MYTVCQGLCPSPVLGLEKNVLYAKASEMCVFISGTAHAMRKPPQSLFSSMAPCLALGARVGPLGAGA